MTHNTNTNNLFYFFKINPREKGTWTRALTLYFLASIADSIDEVKVLVVRGQAGNTIWNLKREANVTFINLNLKILSIHYKINFKYYTKNVGGHGYGYVWFGLGWVEEIFRPNPSWWVKKNPTQPNPSQGFNPTHIDRVGSGWTHGLNIFYFILLLLLLNWKKKISPVPPKLINKIFMN